VLKWPWAGSPGAHVTIDGKSAAIRPVATAQPEEGELRIPRMPARIVIDRPTAKKP
jgi:hypothetical protein